MLQKIGSSGRFSFEQIISDMPGKVAVIFNFLAILELLQVKAITIQIGLGFNNFWIEAPEEEQAA